MATRESRGVSGGGPLPGVLPFSLPHASRLSWELGARTVDGAALAGEWDHADSSWSLAVFEATSATVIVRVTTPAGRERFYGVARMDLESALPKLAASSAWRPTERGRDADAQLRTA